MNSPFFSKSEKLSTEIARHLDAVTSVIPIEFVNVKWALDVYRAKRNDRQYTDEAVSVIDNNRLYLLAKAPRINFQPRPGTFFWFWNNRLYPLYTLTFWWPSSAGKSSFSFIAFFKFDSRELELLGTKPIQVILIDGQRCTAAIELNFEAVAPAMSRLLAPELPFESIKDEVTAKSLVHFLIKEPTTREGKLEEGWAMRFDNEVRWYIRFFRLPEISEEIQKEREVVLASSFGKYFEGDKSPVAELYNAYQEALWVEHQQPVHLLEKLSSELSGAKIHYELIIGVMVCAWYSARGTARGQEISSVNSDGSFAALRLDTERMGDRAKHFWERIIFRIPVDHKQLLGADSFPLELESFIRNTPRYVGDIAEGREHVSNLLAEAVALKQWTIPFGGAYVLLEVGVLKAVKLYEIGETVICVLLNDLGEFLLIYGLPHKGCIAYSTVIEKVADPARKIAEEKWIAQGKSRDDPEFPRYAEELSTRHTLGIEILLASAIRDFWVVEERERVFGVAGKAKKVPRLASDRGKQTITYLPRIRYVGDIQNLGETLNLVARLPHLVTGHLRKALQASEQQIQLALRYGITVPEGFTFVKPHKRGDKAQERIYRSRSALQCIRALDPIGLEGRPDSWFTYELNTKKWLATNGYEVDHLAGSKRGDGGVDIQASKGDEHLLVQCKYWQKEKIGPSIIREMMGTLQTYPEGARGVIVTLTELTDGAKILAMDNGIQFIERVNFISDIDRKI